MPDDSMQAWKQYIASQQGGSSQSQFPSPQSSSADPFKQVWDSVPASPTQSTSGSTPSATPAGNPADKFYNQIAPQGDKTSVTDIAKNYAKQALGDMGSATKGFVEAPFKMIGDTASLLWRNRDTINPISNIANGRISNLVMPFAGVGQDVTAGVLNSGIQNAYKAQHDAQQGHWGDAIAHGAGVVPLIGPAISGIYDKIQAGDHQGAAEDIGNLAFMAATGPKGPLSEATADLAGTVASRAGKVISKTGVISDDPSLALRNVFLKPAADAESSAKLNAAALRQAAPTNRPNFVDNLKNYAVPATKEAEGITGVPVTDLKSAQVNVDAALKRNLQQQRAFMPQLANGSFDGDLIADQITSHITNKMKLEAKTDPMVQAKIDRLKNTAAAYRGQKFSFEDLDQIREDANAEEGNYYAKNPGARRIAQGADPELAANIAIGNQARKMLYDYADNPPSTAPAPIRDLRKEQGALLEYKDALLKRQTVAARQTPVSLAEQMNGLDVAKGVIKNLGNLKFGDAAVSLAEGLARTKLAKWAKDWIGTDQSIQRAYSNMATPRKDFGMPQNPILNGVNTPRLGPATQGPIIGPGTKPLVTPPPAGTIDTSGPMARTFPPGSGNNRLLSPPSQVQQNGFQVTDAQPVKDPITGRVNYFPQHAVKAGVSDLLSEGKPLPKNNPSPKLQVIESPTAKYQRENVHNPTVIKTIDAGRYKNAWEQKHGEPLAWSQERADALKGAQTITSHPVLDYNGEVIDGRHRIAEAARQGKNIDVAVQKPEGYDLTPTIKDGKKVWIWQKQ